MYCAVAQAANIMFLQKHIVVDYFGFREVFSEIVCLHFGSAVETSELDTYVEPTQLADEPSVRDSESCKERVVVFFFAELIRLAVAIRVHIRLFVLDL